MTLHMDIRMNQRGINAELVDLTLEHGTWDGDKCRLDKKALEKLIARFERASAAAKRAHAKGGLVVVEAGGETITTYANPTRRRNRR